MEPPSFVEGEEIPHTRQGYCHQNGFSFALQSLPDDDAGFTITSFPRHGRHHEGVKYSIVDLRSTIAYNIIVASKMRQMRPFIPQLHV